jgi:hypothetical protein
MPANKGKKQERDSKRHAEERDFGKRPVRYAMRRPHQEKTTQKDSELFEHVSFGHAIGTAQCHSP